MRARVISAVEHVMGRAQHHRREIASYRKGQGRVIKETKVACDFVAMSGGWNPVLHLWCHNGGKIRFDDALQTFRPDRHADAITAIGAANGTFALLDILEEAMAAPPPRSLGSGNVHPVLPKAVQADELPLEPIWLLPPPASTMRATSIHRLPERRDGRRPGARPARRL